MQTQEWYKRLSEFKPEEQQHIVDAGIEAYKIHSQFIGQRDQTEIYNNIQANFQHSIKEKDNYIAQIENVLKEKNTAMTNLEKQKEKQEQHYEQEYNRFQQLIQETREKTREETEEMMKERIELMKQQQQESSELQKELRGQIQVSENMYYQLQKQLFDEKEELRNKCEEQHKKEMSEQKKELRKIQKNMEERIENEMKMREELQNSIQELNRQMVDTETRELNRQLDELNKECCKKQEQIDNFIKLYESSSKGQNYEKEILDRLQDWISSNGEAFDIEHVGQIKDGHRGDLVLTHKASGIRIMIDLKNKKTARVDDIKQIKRDVCNETNGYSAGLLVCLGKISTKQVYEEEQVDGKTVVYISEYKGSQVGWLFCVVYRIIREMREKEDAFDLETYRNNLIIEYDFLSGLINKTKQTLNDTQSRIDVVSSSFSRQFGQDIEQYKKYTKELTEGKNINGGGGIGSGGKSSRKKTKSSSKTNKETPTAKNKNKVSCSKKINEIFVSTNS